MRRGCRWYVLVMAAAAPAAAQELAPRSLQNVPVGTMFLIGAAGYSSGNLLFNPALPIKDGTGDVWSVTAAFTRTLDLFGFGSKATIAVPFATGTWQGFLAGVDTSTSRTGFADPVIGLAVNFIGSPALTLSQFREYRQRTVVGFQLQVSVPLGQYYPDRLINLGSNRWSFAPQLGISQAIGRWNLEAYGGATFFTTNTDFYGGTTFSQQPFFTVEGDIIYTIHNNGTWVALSAGYGWGGEGSVGGVSQEPLQNTRLSATLRIPIKRRHALKFIYVNGLTTKLGADFNTYQIGYQYVFGGKH